MQQTLALVAALLASCQPRPPAQAPSGATFTPPLTPASASATALPTESQDPDSTPSSTPQGNAGRETSHVVHGPPTQSGGTQVRVVVQNRYLTHQFVFLGERLLGGVSPGTQGEFEFTPGPQQLNFSDSEDGQQNRRSVAEVFDAGYTYHYDIVAR